MLCDSSETNYIEGKVLPGERSKEYKNMVIATGIDG